MLKFELNIEAAFQSHGEKHCLLMNRVRRCPMLTLPLRAEGERLPQTSLGTVD